MFLDVLYVHSSVVFYLVSKYLMAHCFKFCQIYVSVIQCTGVFISSGVARVLFSRSSLIKLTTEIFARDWRCWVSCWLFSSLPPSSVASNPCSVESRPVWRVGTPKSCERSTASSHGWWAFSPQSRVCDLLHRCLAFRGDGWAQSLLSECAHPPVTMLSVLSSHFPLYFQPFFKKKIWHKNLMAVAIALCFCLLWKCTSSSAKRCCSLGVFKGKLGQSILSNVEQLTRSNFGTL